MKPELSCAGKILGFDQTRIMGILNITPDSFYAGSRYQKQWLQAAEEMVENGVDIIDVGGESTRPGAGGALAPEDELNRILPVVETLASTFDAIVSIDTSSAQVIKRAACAGAGMINDVRALQREGALKAAAASELPVILMHSLVNQPAPDFIPHYDDVVIEVQNYLQDRVRVCEQAGISRNRLLIDPGFGGGMFGKTMDYDLSLLKHFSRFQSMGLPVLAGLSRKSFIGAVLDNKPEDRLSGSLAAAALAAQAGAKIIRVHDVKETKDVVRIVDAVRQST